MTRTGLLLTAVAALASVPGGGCAPEPADEQERATVVTGSIEQQPWGTTPDGAAVELVTLSNPGGMEVRIATYGGAVVSVRVPDRGGRVEDVTLGYDSLGGYLAGNSFQGALIGRYGNRIAGGRFSLDGREYALARNNPPNHLHGGARGFDKVVWRAEPVRGEGGVGVALSYRSRDGEEGYPGNLSVRVVYTLTPADELAVDYTATTDRPTPVNLTQHSYWNLAGHGAGSILDHELQILASRFTPVDAELIPTGELRAVDGTPFDFRTPAAVGARIEQDDPQLRHGHGYDHNWVLDRRPEDPPSVAARLYHPGSGRVLEVLTTEPGLQVYSGNWLDGRAAGKGGAAYGRRSGIALEAQHFPDSPNQPGFPSTVLRPGDTLRSRTVYRFGVREGGG